MTVPGSRRPERAADRTLAARLPAGVPGAPGVSRRPRIRLAEL